MKNTKLSFFFGPGGVGKSSLAASYAYHQTLTKINENDQKILIMSIDPSLRLKQFFSLSDQQPQKDDGITHASYGDKEMDLFLMDGHWAINMLLKKNSKNPNLDKLRLLNILSHRLGGLNEILSFLCVHHFLSLKTYDRIIIDTAPGGHFLDFFLSVPRIQNFFEEKLIKIFERVILQKYKSNLFTKFIDLSFQKLMTYLEKLTGSHFVQDFIESIMAVYDLKESFKSSLQLIESLKNPEITQYFLVATPDRSNETYLISLKEEIIDRSGITPTLLLNQSFKLMIEKDLSNPFWNQDLLSQKNKEWKNYLETMILREDQLLEKMKLEFLKIFPFPLLPFTGSTPNLQSFQPYWGTYDQQF
ncbi:MAG: ArsA-related P-loop ATPase [Bacteriovoracaceae bacterium]|nr:ArsA-related P-loop ATPase [Bacteriovoracaceae bacterium]